MSELVRIGEPPVAVNQETEDPMGVRATKDCNSGSAKGVVLDRYRNEHHYFSKLAYVVSSASGKMTEIRGVHIAEGKNSIIICTCSGVFRKCGRL